jgi:predicted metal-dependent hydrolase
MSTASAHLTIRGIGIDVVRKDIKNLHIGVYPPAGRVRVAAPTRLNDDQVRLAVIQRLSWIKTQQHQLRSAERQSEREMVSGESHYVWGRRLRLKVVERPGRAHVELDGGRLLIYVPQGSSTELRRELLDRWYREQLHSVMPSLVERWAQIIDVPEPEWRVRRMKTKWGSYSAHAHRIWLNAELAKKHPDCLEYIVVHELAHFLERTHGSNFVDLMDNVMPNWRRTSAQLNYSPLDAQHWTFPAAPKRDG